jgi:glutamate--cysteine ligase
MLNYEKLVEDMHSGCKPRAAWRLGIEYERFAFNRADGSPLPYDGTPGIRALLENFAARYGWSLKYEGDHPIGLQKGQKTITLEPGGQVEYSGSPLPDLDAVVQECDDYLRSMAAVADEMGIGFTAKGFPPTWRRADIQWMPKERYGIMRPYMEKVGQFGIDMMGRTCGTQINIDFDSEQDMINKFRVALAFQPAINALMANSRMVEGKDSGYASYRGHVWTDTDKARSGFLPFVFAPDMSFARYVDYALDVPMYFVRRDGHHINVAGQSFRDFMDGKLRGFEGQYPTLEDWHDHLTTLFPDVRLKKYLEMRGPDSHEPEMVYAMAAFWTGILYDEETLRQAVSLIEKNPAMIAPAIRGNVARLGLGTAMPDTEWATICDFAAEITGLAARGLPRHAHLLQPFQFLCADCAEPRRRVI